MIESLLGNFRWKQGKNSHVIPGHFLDQMLLVLGKLVRSFARSTRIVARIASRMNVPSHHVIVRLSLRRAAKLPVRIAEFSLRVVEGSQIVVRSCEIRTGADCASIRGFRFAGTIQSMIGKRQAVQNGSTLVSFR